MVLKVWNCKPTLFIFYILKSLDFASWKSEHCQSSVSCDNSKQCMRNIWSKIFMFWYLWHRYTGIHFLYGLERFSSWQRVGFKISDFDENFLKISLEKRAWIKDIWFWFSRNETQRCVIYKKLNRLLFQHTPFIRLCYIRLSLSRTMDKSDWFSIPLRFSLSP